MGDTSDTSDTPNIAFVYGSFQNGDCVRDVQIVRENYPGILGLAGFEAGDPVEGNAFDFNSLKDVKVLVLCTSSKLGFPPPNMLLFAYQLLVSAKVNPSCLQHMRHVVCGNGQEMYEETYMNMPRYMDKLLEACGSRRFFPRGEFGEPNAALDTDECDCKEWAIEMWKALTDTIASDGDGENWSAVPWDALWAKKESPIHHNVTEWDLVQLEKNIAKASLTPPPHPVFAKL